MAMDLKPCLWMVLAGLLLAGAAGCDGTSGEDGATGGSGVGPVGTLLFWKGKDYEPVVLDTRTGAMQRGGVWPRNSLQLSLDGWGATFTEKGHLYLRRILGDGAWEPGGDIGAWMEYTLFSPDNRSVIGVTGPEFQSNAKAVHYGRFNEDGSIAEQFKLDGDIGNILMGEGGVIWSPDNEHFAVTLSDGLALYKNGERVWFLPKQHVSGLEWLRTASFSPDGQWLAISVYEWPKLAVLPLHRGFQLYSVADRTFVRPQSGPQDSKGGMIDMMEGFWSATGGALDVPQWTYDGRGLILNRWRPMLENSSNTCGNENPVPIRVLRIPESFLQAAPVVDDLSVLVPEERVGGRCLRWRHLGSIPENEAELFGFEYREKRTFGMASSDVANSAYVVIHLTFVEVPLDGTDAREIGYYDNDAPGSGFPFGVTIYPFPDYSLRCRSGQTGEFFFRNGIILDPEEGVARGGQAALDRILLSGDCNCRVRQASFTGDSYEIIDLKEATVSTLAVDPELLKTNYFMLHDWR